MTAYRTRVLIDAARTEIRAERRARDDDPVIVTRRIEVPGRLGCLVSWAADPRNPLHAGAVWGSLDLDAEPSTREEARDVVRELRVALESEPTPDWAALLYGGGPEELRRRVASAALWVVQCMEADGGSTATY